MAAFVGKMVIRDIRRERRSIALGVRTRSCRVSVWLAMLLTLLPTLTLVIQVHARVGGFDGGHSFEASKTALAGTADSTILQRSDGLSSDPWVDEHNYYRVTLGLPLLSFDSDLQARAVLRANQLQKICNITSAQDTADGENLFMYQSASEWHGMLEPSEVVSEWMAQSEYHDYSANRCVVGYDCSCYTQVVWRGTLRVGCASVSCSTEGGSHAQIFLCRYSPAGNAVGVSPY
eukprot:TRINITY_DN759_c1_g2_i1.p1 TRINITY_DN759_c1_g2~~TRINITY_DN759_c1_g2_i1.p1  ORF type:complete len:245 (-),score=22.93 TRINITY_DN759_c1_g2_i1:516-1214(-)